MTLADLLGYLAAVLVLATFSMRTMLPLRISGIASNCVFIAYGYVATAYPILILHIILLPLNSLRLYQMQQLIKRVREASRGDLSMDWLKPYMTARQFSAGEIVFRKGDVAEKMYYTVTGRYRLVEIDANIEPGQIIGEIAFIAPDKRRTLTFACAEGGQLLTISYSQLGQLYFQNPRFGLYFLQLIADRLFKDIGRLEAVQTPLRRSPE
jgi:CRP/FNR family transcriptional regulator, cyclic AMP receptor protein